MSWRFFWISESTSRELSMATAACVLSADAIASSSCVKPVGRALVQDLEHADGAAEVIAERRREHAGRAVTGEQIPFLLEARVPVGVGNAKGLTARGHEPGNAVADLHADRAHLSPDHDAAHELVPGLVEQVQRGAIGLEELGDLRENELEQIVEVEGRPERGPHLAQGSRNALLAAQGVRQPRRPLVAERSRLRLDLGGISEAAPTSRRRMSQRRLDAFSKIIRGCPASFPDG